MRHFYSTPPFIRFLKSEPTRTVSQKGATDLALFATRFPSASLDCQEQIDNIFSHRTSSTFSTSSTTSAIKGNLSWRILNALLLSPYQGFGYVVFFHSLTYNAGETWPRTLRINIVPLRIGIHAFSPLH